MAQSFQQLGSDPFSKNSQNCSLRSKRQRSDNDSIPRNRTQTQESKKYLHRYKETLCAFEWLASCISAVLSSARGHRPLFDPVRKVRNRREVLQAQGAATLRPRAEELPDGNIH